MVFKVDLNFQSISTMVFSATGEKPDCLSLIYCLEANYLPK